MNFYKVFYWMTVADSVNTFLLTIAIIAAVITGVSLIGYVWATTDLTDTYKSDKDKANALAWQKTWKRLYIPNMIVSIIFGITVVFTPTKKDCYVIVAGGAIGNFVTTDSNSRAIPAEAMRLVKNYLKSEADGIDLETKKELGIATPKETFLDKIKGLTADEIKEMIKSDTTLGK